MSNIQKLELTWIGKNNPEYDISNIEPRILEEKPELSNCENDPNTENMIIHGDNLLALKALLPEYEGKIKCIYIDPPYNTGNAFEHYDDNVEHSLWLSLMKPRLELLKLLLSDDGAIFVQIDDNEHAYLKVLMDEIFGRSNLNSVITVKVASESGVKVGANKPVRVKENILIYSKSQKYVYNRQFVPDQRYAENYSYFVENKDEEPKNWKIINIKEAYFKYTKNISQNPDEKELYGFQLKYKENIFSVRDISDNLKSEFGDNPNQFIIKISDRKKTILWKKGEVVFFSNKVKLIDGIETATKYLSDIWLDIKWDGIAKEGNVIFKQSKKPEKLIQRILEMSTKPNDFVLDSFLGSGTTSAVAHKMNRKYIGIEMGNHAHSHCKVRMDKVIDGSDQGGVSKILNWRGGGAYKFYELAPSFITTDEFGNSVIDSFYNDTKLIKAICKIANFTFKPSQSQYWIHGTGQVNNYIYVTTQILSIGIIEQIKSHLKNNESLTIYAKKFESGCETYDSKIIVKKIPQAVLNACQFGKKEYLLPIKEISEESEYDDEE